jgi:hypothetical protein
MFHIYIKTRMADIKISLDDTLEIDTIVNNWDTPSNLINDKNDGFKLSGLQTKTGILQPKDPGTYRIDINGQELTVEVTDPSNVPEASTDSFEDGDYNNWSVKSGSWKVKSYGGDNWIENTSSGNNEIIEREYNTIEPSMKFEWSLNHSHGGQFYGAQAYLHYGDGGDSQILLSFKNSNSNYEREFNIIENGSSQIDLDLGDYNGGNHSYNVKYDGSGGWKISVDGTEVKSASYEPSFSFSIFRLKADDNGHRWNNIRSAWK